MAAPPKTLPLLPGQTKQLPKPLPNIAPWAPPPTPEPTLKPGPDIEELNANIGKMWRLDPSKVKRARQTLFDGELKFALDFMESDLLVPRELAESALEKCIKAGDSARAVRLLDAAITGHNPGGDLAKNLFKIGVSLFVFLGLLGGVVALFKVVFG